MIAHEKPLATMENHRILPDHFIPDHSLQSMIGHQVLLYEFNENGIIGWQDTVSPFVHEIPEGVENRFITCHTGR
jgi:hypothetical protein